MTERQTTNTPDELRLFAGLIVQPFVAAGLAFISFPWLERSGRAIYGGTSTNPMDAAMSVAVGVGMVAFVIVLVGALPAVLWLAKRGPITLKHTMLFGVALGNIPVVIGTGATRGGYGPAGSARAVLFASFLGLVCAVAFWAISIHGTDFGKKPSNGPPPTHGDSIEFE